MILSAQSIRRRKGIITPFFERTISHGMSFGLSSCGYDVRIAQRYLLGTGRECGFMLASTIEHFDMPTNIVGRVHDKSTWARRGVAVQNTIIEPGWRGHLTLELSNNGSEQILFEEGMPIAQIIFELLDEPTHQPYQGKYQDQAARPIPAKLEE